MYILFVVVVFILGVALTAAAFFRRESNFAHSAAVKAERQAEENRREAYSATQNACYYQRQAQYWQGVAYGDKANAIYGMALQSVQEGSGFSFHRKPAANNITPFPTNHES